MTSVRARTFPLCARLGATLLVLASLACESPVEPLNADQRARLEDEVREAVAAFADAERDRDVERIVATLAPDFYMYADGARADHDAVVTRIRSTIPTLARFETTWSDVEVTLLAVDHALVSFVFHDSVTDAAGETTRVTGPTTLVWRRDDARWRLIYADADHYPSPGRP